MNEVKVNRVYKHFKGDLYLVEDIAIHSETNEKYVVYRALYGENLLYIRPYDMFISEVDHEKYPNIKRKYRFELQNIKSVKEVNRTANKFNEILETNKFVVDNAKHVKINYDKVDTLVDELLKFNNVHYLTKVPYDVYGMSTKDLINFLLVYDSIDFSFWGNPKWTIDANGKNLDGGIALLYCIFNLFNGHDSVEVYRQLENMSLEEFGKLLKGNIDIPLLEERYRIVTEIATIVNAKMNGNFYEYINGMNSDQEIFSTILEYFDSFEDTRTYEGKTIYFYKLAQLLTSDILHVIENKEQKEIDYSNLLGCADYKIPQVMQGLGILEYDEELSLLLDTKTEIAENSEYEVEIRASQIVAINYIWEKIDKCVDRIDINDFIWEKGQDKTKKYKSYHLTRTTSY